MSAAIPIHISLEQVAVWGDLHGYNYEEILELDYYVCAIDDAYIANVLKDIQTQSKTMNRSIH